MSEPETSLGRIEVAPEVLVMIARQATLEVAGIHKLVGGSTDGGRFRRRHGRHEGIVLDISNNRIKFDLFLLMAPDVNILETSRAVQNSVMEAIDKMIGIPVESVNVHVEDVVYTQGQAA